MVQREVFLIRPPTSFFTFTPIHGLTWKDVENAPTFAELWSQRLRAIFESAEKLVAHNIGFDAKVLRATAAHYGIELPELATECTVRLSRHQLGISPANLKNVSQTLGIELQHHEALSDATAAAHIYVHAKTGRRPWEQPGLFD